MAVRLSQKHESCFEHQKANPKGKRPECESVRRAKSFSAGKGPVSCRPSSPRDFSCVRKGASHQRINQAKNHINPRNRSATTNHSTYSIPCLISASSLSIVGSGLGSSAVGRVAPHFPHKLASSGLSAPQLLHFVVLASGFESPYSPMVFSEARLRLLIFYVISYLFAIQRAC